MLRCEQLSSDHQDGMRGRVKCHQHSSVFSLFKFKSLCVRQGENRDFDTYKEVKKYENIIIEKVVKSFYGGFVVSLIKKGICPKFKNMTK